MIELDRVIVAFDGRPVVDDVSLSVPPAGWTCLIGPNGAGKTTLLRAVAGLVPFEGQVRVGGIPIGSLGRRRLAQLVAFVPQRPSFPAAMTVTDYVLIGRTPYISYLGTEGRQDLEIVATVLDRLDLGAFVHRSLGSLSGGELQRVVLARALAQEAPLLLLDEPTSSLDVGHQQQVLELVDSLRWDRRLTVVSAMHDLTLAGQFAENLVLLSAGRAVGQGPARSVLTEAAIGEHYGASVKVIETADDGVLVIPTRSRHVPSESEEAFS